MKEGLKKSIIVVMLFFVSLFFITGCATVYNPVTRKQELTLINSETEKALGANVATQINREQKLYNDSKVLSRVRSIGNAVAVQSGRRNIHFEFNVIDTDKINAVAIPGGYIYLYRGLVEKITDDELACVIGHEIAHIDARHGVKKLQAVMGYQLLMSLAFGGKKHDDLVSYANMTFDLISKSYSRRDELQADKIGIIYVYRAGYDPEAMVSLVEKLKKLNKNSYYNIEFFSTHPNFDTRISALESEIAKLKTESKN